MDRAEAVNKLNNADIIYICIDDMGRNRECGSFPYFTLWTQTGLNTPTKVACEDSPYWSTRKSAYAMSVWGSERSFELLYSLAQDINLAAEWDKKTTRMW